MDMDGTVILNEFLILIIYLDQDRDLSELESLKLLNNILFDDLKLVLIDFKVSYANACL